MQILGIVGKYPRRCAVKKAIRHITESGKKLIKLKKQNIILRITATENELKNFKTKGETIIIKLKDIAIVWNPKNHNPLTITRKSPGRTPLLYRYDAKEKYIVFSTNMLAMTELLDTPEMHPQQVGQYLTRGYTTGDNTLIHSIHRLNCGERLSLTRTCDIEIRRGVKTEENLNKYLQEFDNIFSDAIRKTAECEYVLFSGGLLSSLIVTKRNQCKLQTIPITILFDNKSIVNLDNVKLIKQIFPEIQAIEKTIPNSEIRKITKKMFAAIDQPIGDIKMIINNAIYHQASQYSNRLISGIGGSFYGGGYYHRYKPFIDLQENIQMRAVSINVDHAEEVMRNAICPDEDIPEMLKNIDIDILREIQKYETTNFIPDSLLYVEYLLQNHNNIDISTPFLDNRVSKFLLNLPSHYKVIGEFPNWFLRKYAEYIGLPPVIAWSEKQAQPLAIFDYLLEEGEKFLESDIHKKFIDSKEFFKSFESENFLEMMATQMNPKYQLRYIYLLLLAVWKENYGQ